MSVSESAMQLAPGQTKPLTLTFQRTNFTGRLTLTVEGLPTGVTASFLPATLEGATSGSILTLVAAANAPSTTAPVTIRATGAGIDDNVATLTLTVGVAGSYTLAAVPGTATVAQGGGAVVTLQVARTGGFNGSVGMALSGLPDGLTATLDPAAITATTTSVRLTLTGSAAVPTGSHTITVTGTTSGLSDRTTTVAVTVIPPPATTAASVPFCAGQVPLWFAYRNEGGLWTRVTPSTNNFQFDASERTAIAYAQQTGGAVDMTVLYLTRQELVPFESIACAPSLTNASGTIQGLGPADSAVVAMGSVAAVQVGSGTFALTNVPAAPRDFVAFRRQQGRPTSFAVRRGVDPSAGAIDALDFGGTEPFAPALALATAEIGPAFGGIGTTFRSAGGTAVSLFAIVTPDTLTVRGVPADRLVDGDIHEVWAAAYTQDLTGERASRQYLKELAPVTIPLGPQVGFPAFGVVASTPNLRVRMLVDAPAFYDAGFIVDLYQPSMQRGMYTIVTKAFVGTLPTVWDVSTPDFSGVAGYDPSWGLQAGVSVNWAVIPFGGSTDLVFGRAPVPGDNLTYSAQVGSNSGASGASAQAVPGEPVLRDPARIRSRLR